MSTLVIMGLGLISDNFVENVKKSKCLSISHKVQQYFIC